jgi:hypothetical protein
MRREILGWCGVVVVALVAGCGGVQMPEDEASDELKQNAMVACRTDADCVAIEAPSCCPDGTKVAVNEDHVQAYQAQNQCKHAPQFCPHHIINDTRVAECNNATHACEMVKIEDIHCKGFMLNSHQCPTGYQCQFSGVPDVGGSCVLEQQPTQPATDQTCGGFAGLACPSGQHCQYDPSVCDPDNGGRDCAGICVAD